MALLIYGLRSGKPNALESWKGSLIQSIESTSSQGLVIRTVADMTTEDRLMRDYAGTGLTVGRHPMAYRREELRQKDILSADELKDRPHGRFVRAAGCIIARQRPGTAHGFIFISMEDETGIANVIVTPDLYERDRMVVTRSKFILVEGPLQNQDGVIHVKATRLQTLSDLDLEIRSHDFH